LRVITARVAYLGIVPWLFCSVCVQAADTAPAAARIDHGKLEGVWVSTSPYHFPAVEKFLGFQLGGVDQSDFIAVQTVPPLKDPYVTQWKAREVARHEADLNGQPLADEYSHCMPGGMPSMMMAMFPMEVTQAPGDITIVEEAFREVRHIYLNQKQIPISDAEPEFWGHSVGRWEGDTLIVNTVGIKESVQLEDVPHSDQMRIDERITLQSADTFEDAIAVTDPVYLARPWLFAWTYRRDPGYKLLEYVCEDNREDAPGPQQHLRLFGN
jgi:hypothetical protein